MSDVVRAGIYLRVSTEEQAAGYGLDVQRERAVALAVAKGWVPACEFADEGVSGTVDPLERGGMRQLLDSVEAGDIDAVVVLALDRLGRSTRIVLDVVDKLAEAGCELVSCKESLDTSTPAGSFVLTIFAALAQLERDTIVERTAAGRDARGKIDGERGGRVPIGYVRTPNGIEVDDDAAAVVKTIFRQRKTGATLQAVADKLNVDGISTPRGGQWHPSSVSVVLRNEGKYRGGKRGRSPVKWPKILSSS